MHSPNVRARVAGALSVLGAVLWLASTLRADFLVTNDFGDSILRFSNNGSALGAFVSSGGGGLDSPQAMAWGPDGRLYVAGSRHVKAYNGTTGAYEETVYLWPGEAMDAYGLFFAPNGDMLVSLDGLMAVRRVDVVTHNVIATIPTGCLPTKMVLAPDGNVLVGNGDGGVNDLRKIDLATNQVSIFASGGGLAGVLGMDYGPDGNLYAANAYGDYGIYRVDPHTGTVLGKFVDSGVIAAADVLFLPGNRMWVSGLLTNELNRFNASTGEFLYGVSGGSPNWDLLYVPEPAAAGGAIVMGALLVTRRRGTAN